VKIKDYVEQINQTDRDRNVELDLQQTNEGWKHAA